MLCDAYPQLATCWLAFGANPSCSVYASAEHYPELGVSAKAVPQEAHQPGRGGRFGPPFGGGVFNRASVIEGTSGRRSRGRAIVITLLRMGFQRVSTTNGILGG